MSERILRQAGFKSVKEVEQIIAKAQTKRLLAEINARLKENKLMSIIGSGHEGGEFAKPSPTVGHTLDYDADDYERLQNLY